MLGNVGNVRKKPNYRLVLIAFISGSRCVEDKKMMNMWHQVIVSNSEAPAMVSTDVQCHTCQRRSMSQSNCLVMEKTCML